MKKGTPAKIEGEIAVGAQYSRPDIFAVENPDPAMRYFHAAGGTDATRPDGVVRLEAEGYRRTEQQSKAPGHVLMEIPRETWLARERAKWRSNENALRSAMTGTDGLERLPGHQHGVGKGGR